MKKGNDPLEVTISNLVNHPELQPDNLKTMLKRLSELYGVAENIEKSLAQAQQSVNGLVENRARVVGSMETLVSILEEQLPDELIQKYGKEYIEPKKA